MPKKKPFDKQVFLCLYCKQFWELTCNNRLVTEEEFKNWTEEVKKQHSQNCDK